MSFYGEQAFIEHLLPVKQVPRVEDKIRDLMQQDDRRKAVKISLRERQCSRCGGSGVGGGQRVCVGVTGGCGSGEEATVQPWGKLEFHEDMGEDLDSWCLA